MTIEENRTIDYYVMPSGEIFLGALDRLKLVFLNHFSVKQTHHHHESLTDYLIVYLLLP